MLKGMMVFVCIILFSTQAFARTPDQFLTSLINEATSIRDNRELGEKEKVEAYRDIFNQNFNLPVVGRFVLGKYWRRFQPTQRDLFLDLFSRIIVSKFAPLMAEASIERLQIGNYRFDSNYPDIWTLKSTYVTDDDKRVKISWRGKQNKIVDIIAEGVSFAITYRSEYGTAIRTMGIEKFLIELEKKAEK